MDDRAKSKMIFCRNPVQYSLHLHKVMKSNFRKKWVQDDQVIVSYFDKGKGLCLTHSEDGAGMHQSKMV